MVLYRRSTCHYQFLREGNNLVITKTQKGEKSEVDRVAWHSGPVVLQAEARGLDLQFSYDESENDLRPLGDVQTMAVISFEVADGFNGPYVGMYATGKPSDNRAAFDWFEYKGE